MHLEEFEYENRAAAQRDHSKLQKPPSVPASDSGAAAAATNTTWQERTAADVTRACSSSRPRRLAAEPGLGGFCQLVRAVRRPVCRLLTGSPGVALQWRHQNFFQVDSPRSCREGRELAPTDVRHTQR